MTPDKIYLDGFMAAGKTTVARALAARVEWRAEDIDELIEARERRTVADIFAKNGEPYFRALERDILRMLLPLRHVVVATGGGRSRPTARRWNDCSPSGRPVTRTHGSAWTRAARTPKQSPSA